MRWACALGLVFVLAASAPAGEAKDDVVVPPLGPRLDEAVLRAGGSAFWGAVLVAQGGKIVLAKGYGFADYDKRPNSAYSLFEIASASKQVTATAILRLEQEKRLKTSDPIDRWLKGVPADKHAVTIDHLLHHTSGLDPGLGVPYAWTGSREAYVKQVLEKPLAAEPGKTFSYSNVGYALLAAIVEEVTGKPFEDYVRKQLFATAGLADTGFIHDDRLVKSDRVTTRRCDGCLPNWTAANWFWGWGYRGMGGVVTTAIDLLGWDRALRGDKILQAPAKAKLYAPGLGGYGCGWFVEATDRGTTKVHHSGGVRGYAVEIARWLEEDAFVCVLSNGKTDPMAVASAIEALLFEPAKVAADLDVEGLTLSKYRAFQAKEGVALGARREESSVRLDVTLGTHALARLTLPPGTARRLAGEFDLAAAANAESDDGSTAAAEAGLYFLSYGDEVRVHLDEGLAVRVQPEYRGRGEDGRPIVDRRALLVLDDAPHHQWPLLVWMNVAAARDLATSLRAATAPEGR
jgi:CubicO group peptidase (beta-lactamase class C family)